jgi:hypothetical protein
MHNERLAEIMARAKAAYQSTPWEGIAAIDKGAVYELAKTDVPALVREVERLRALVKYSLTPEPSGIPGELPPGYYVTWDTFFYSSEYHTECCETKVWHWECESDDGIGRNEDDAIAAAWDHYRANGGA